MKHVIGFNSILGIWLMLSPFAFGYDRASTGGMWNDLIVGILIIGCSWSVVVDVPGQVWCCVCGLASGIWLMLAPWALNYRVEEFGHDLMIGASVLVISAIETWRMTHGSSSVA